MNDKALIESTLAFAARSDTPSKSQIARSIGISASQLTLFLRNEYKMTEETKEKLGLYIKNYTQKKAGKKEEPFVMTKQAKSIFFVCDECVMEGEMGIVYGHPGTGKTTALKHYARQNPQSVLLEVEPGIGPREFLWNLADMLGADRAISKAATTKNIVRRLTLRDTIIIIDEAEHLRIEALEHLRRIWDFSRTPIVLGGTEVLLKKLMGTKGDMAQLYSRIGLKWHTKPLQGDELGDICEAWNIDPSNGPIITKMVDGNLRKAAKLIKRSIRLAELSGTKVTGKTLDEASRMLIL